MADRSRSTLQALIIQDTAWTADCLASDSSFTGISPLAGTPQPAASTYAMGLAASGSFADPTKTITVTTQQGGIVGRDLGATFRWGTSDSLTYGWDAPTVLTGYETVVWSTSNLKTHPFILPLANGSLLAVWQYGSLCREIYTSTRTTSWSSPVAITTDTAWALGCSPCLLQLPSGKILLYAWVSNNGATTAIIRALQSNDSGSTWTLASSGCLPASISMDPATGYTIQQMRVAYSAGQIMIIVSLKDNRGAPPLATPYEIRQYASSDGGNSFSLVYQSDTTVSSPHTEEMRWPDLVVANGNFYVSVIDYAINPAIYALSSAYLPMSSVTPAAISLASAPEETAIQADETGVLFLTTRIAGSGNRWIAYTSVDAGTTWAPMARSALASSGGLWWNADDNDTYPAGLHSCWYQGEWLLLGGFSATPSTYDSGSLVVYALGGYSTVTMPGYDPQRTDAEQVTWGQTWLPLDLPGDAGWTRAVTGTPTESLASGLLAVTVGLPQALSYSRTPGGTVAGGVGACWSASTSSGAYRVRLRTADGASGYQITASLTTTTLTVIDGKTASVLGTVSVAGEVEVLAWITAGVVSVWYRVVTDAISGRRDWARLVDSVALADNGAGWAANLIDWGYPLSNASSGSWRFFHWIDDGTADYVGTGLGSVTLPAGLLGRRYASIPVSLDGSTSIAATCGPTYAGESWAINERYEHGPDAIFPASAPSPRQACWLDNSVSNSLVFDLHTGAEATGLLGRPLALAILGTNAQTASLYGWNGAVWVLAVQWSSAITTGAGWVRSGRIVSITSGGTVIFVTRNQCVGCTIDLGGGKLRRVIANTEGQIGATSSFSAALQIDADGTEGASGTCTFYAAAAVAVVAQPAAYYRFKLTIGATSTPEGYLILGKVLLGSLAVLARRPSNGRQITFVQQAQSTRPPGGPRSWRKLGPSYRRVPLEFGELLPTSQIYAASPSPDYVKLSTAGVGSAALHATALSVAGIIEENLGRYVCYAGNVAQASSNTTTANFLDPQQIVYGRLTDPGALAIVRGNEASGEVLTLTGAVLEEEP